MPGRIVFATSTGASEVERLRIASTGELGLGLTQNPPTGSFTMRLTETPEFNIYSTQHAQNNNIKINFGVGQSASVSGNTGARIEMNIPDAGGQMTGELKFHTNNGDNLYETLRITKKGTVIAYHGTAPSDATTYTSAFRSREGVIGPIYYWPRSYGNHSNGGGYDNVAEGGRLTLRMVGAQGGTAAMFHGGFGVTFGGAGESIEYNRVRVIFRVTRNGTTEGYEQDSITFKMQQYYYSGGWTDISNSSWNFTGMDSERGYRWTASHWISSADFAGGFDVPSIAIKYESDNGNASNHNVRIAAVYLQYARFS